MTQSREPIGARYDYLVLGYGQMIFPAYAARRRRGRRRNRRRGRASRPGQRPAEPDRLDVHHDRRRTGRASINSWPTSSAAATSCPEPPATPTAGRSGWPGSPAKARPLHDHPQAGARRGVPHRVLGQRPRGKARRRNGVTRTPPEDDVVRATNQAGPSIPVSVEDGSASR